MLRCQDVDLLIEAMADGELAPDAALAEHLASCALCASRLRAARAVTSLLVTRDAVEVPDRFTARVMTQVTRGRWRTEQALDVVFNVAVAVGVLSIVTGLAGVLWSFGLLRLNPAVMNAVVAAVSQAIARLAAQAQTIAIAATLLTMALGLWWWAEEEPDF
jgi:anti-sigma factor RsiW